MIVVVNGEQRQVADDATVLALLEGLGLKPKATVVQRNGDIVPRTEYAATHLCDGDVLELIRFVGGG